jgi:glycosyltransferase involved in cell wall biosynthesis
MIKEKILIFIPAYNVEKKITKVLNKIPKIVFNKYNTKILVIEDNSSDKTLSVIKKVIKKKGDKIKIYLIVNKKNKGYGGVQKIAFNYAIKKNFKYVVMLHGDNQYPANKILLLIKPLLTNKYDAVFGSRMINSINALKGGMPLYKYLGNIALTFFQNLVLSSNLSEFHSGYRSYKVSSLKKIKFKINTNDFHFDTEIIIQFLKNNLKIKEIAMSTHYGSEISHLRSIPYGLNIVRSTLVSRFKK